MAKKVEKREIAEPQEDRIVEQPLLMGRGNKTIITMGVVILISVCWAFTFVSKVYPSLIVNSQLDKVGQEKDQIEEIATVQAEKPPELEKVPAASKKKEEKGKEHKEGGDVEELAIVPVETLIVNLSGSNGRRYLKAKINLEAKDADVKKKIETKSVQIKDRLISILSSKTLEDIDGIEGQETLRREIKDAVDVVLKVEGGILQVYFTEFVVQ